MCAWCGCHRPQPHPLPDLPEASTLVLAAVRDGATPAEVAIFANDGSLTDAVLNFADGEDHYLLWHEETPFRLGVAPGIHQPSANRVARAPDGALLATDRGTWEAANTPPALEGMTIFLPPPPCPLLVEGKLEPWTEVPPFTNAARTGPTSVLLGGEDGALYHFNPEQGAEVIAQLGARVMAVAYDGVGAAHALDDRYRLHTVPLDGGSATVIQTSTAGLGYTDTSTTWTMAQLTVGPQGEVHLFDQHLDLSTKPALFAERLAYLSGSRWVRWNSSECGPHEARLDDGYLSRRLVTTSDGSIVAVGTCRSVLLRWREGWSYEFVLVSTVVRELRGRSYVGTKNGGVYEDRDRSGEWGTIITAGGRGIQDLAEAPLGGILVAEFNNSRTVTKVVFEPEPGEVAPQICPLANVAWDGGTTELLQLGEDYLARSSNPVAVWRFTLRESSE